MTTFGIDYFKNQSIQFGAVFFEFFVLLNQNTNLT